jgi:uncharacterized membrane protein YbhN (UPF0104 family)
MTINKNIKRFINYFLGPLLLALFAFNFYRHLQAQKDLGEKWQLIKNSISWAQLGLVFLLMLVNWGLEALKWKVLMKHIYGIGFLEAFKSVLAGSSLSFVTPNRTGEYVGRIIYVQEGNRLRAVPLSIAGGISQLLVTLLAGSISLMFLKDAFSVATASGQNMSQWWINLVIICALGGAICLLLLFFKISSLVRLVEKIPGAAKYSYFFEVLDNFTNRELLNLIALSALRFGVFVLQYVLMMQLFQLEVDFGVAVGGICVLFLVLAILPSIAMAELGLRGETIVQVFGHLGVGNTLALLFTAYGIWMVNIALPALVGALLILSTKIFKQTK